MTTAGRVAVDARADVRRDERPPARAARASGHAWIGPILAVVIGALALILLHRELHALGYRAVSRAVRALPASTIIATIAATIAAYAVLPTYDALALHYVGRPLGARRTVFASVIAHALSQSIGMAALASGSVRYRFWTAWGVPRHDVARGVAFTTVMLWLGVATVGGIACLAGPIPGWVGPAWAHVAAGAALLAVPAGYLAWSATAVRPLSVRRWTLQPPALRIAVAQIVFAALDWVLSALVLMTLLRPLGVPMGLGIRVFLLGQVIGLVSHVPGGLGVFESFVMLALHSTVPPSALLPALVAYRAIYYGLPFGVATVALAISEIVRGREHVRTAATAVGRWVPGTVPYFLSVATFAAGLLLLFSGATPGVHARLRWLDAFFPLAIIELSHFSASMAGIVLVLLANGIRRRVDAAYHVTVVALVVGIVGSLLKGVDVEEAVALAVVLAAVVPARRHFFRRAALLREPMSAGWIAALVLALLATAWLGVFSYGHALVATGVWSRFATVADAPRFLRAMTGVVGVVAAFAIARVLRPLRVAPTPPDDEQLARARTVTRASADVRGHLALLGDKSLLFSASGDAFIMYGVSGRSWVALGDPVGPATEHRELVWRFRELAHRHGGWPVFYQSSRDLLPLCIDLGLTLLKLGEEAHVPLDGFTLEGGTRRGLRRTVNEVERAGVRFELLPADDVPALMPALRDVSDAWLAARRTREKGFSLGYFDPAYLAHFPVAIARTDAGIVAFANVWTSDARHMASADLMRYRPTAPRSVMEYLFIQLMRWARDEGYRFFDLGMAPLSGFEDRALAPTWNRLGGFLYRHGEHFYHFRGLRQYKEKFDPIWEPRYLATPGGLSIPRTLANVTALVSGGLVGAVTR